MVTNQANGTIMKQDINKEDIKKYYEFLGHKGITEVRPIRPRWHPDKSPPRSFFIKSLEDLIKVISELNGEYNVYIGINERTTKGKEDKDVAFITNIGHDIDAHESGEEGLLIAGQIVAEMISECVALGYKEPLVLDSGRGYWVIHHIPPIENTEENVKKIKEFGKRIRTKYARDKIEIDSTVYNPSRITRVTGTMNVSNENNFVMSKLKNNPENCEDIKLREDILKIEIPIYKPLTTLTTPSINSFMDYCLTHEIPKGQRHKVISRHMALYISDNPDRELLRQQYIKIQKGSEQELDNWLKGIDENGKDKYPFNIGELVNFTRKYKIPFDWKATTEYQQWMKEKKAENKLNEEIGLEKKAERLGKAITFFTDKKHLAQQFLKIQPIYYDSSKLWWVWTEKKLCWEICDEIDIMNEIGNHSEANTISSKEKNEILEALKQESRKLKPKNIGVGWIQFKDFIYDIYSGERIKATPEYFVTNPIPWNLGETEETPSMDKIFKEWVGEEKVRTLYEILAYCLLCDYPIHRIFCFIGSGLNGKSKFMDLLRKFVGNQNCCSTDLDTLIASRFEVTRLFKKLVCQMGETNFSELNKTSLLKKLSGEDLIGFEYKNKNPFEDKNYAKIIISTNNLPSTTDKTIGFYRRWMIIDFPNRFSEKKDILLDIPDEEYENFAFKSCRILRELLEKREFNNEGTIEERMERYEARSNFLEKFIEENCSKDNIDGYITKNDFYKKFIAWCKINRHRETTETKLGLDMKKLGIEEGRKYFDWLYDGKGGQVRIWLGIEWK